LGSNLELKSKNQKQRGEWAEMRFLARVAERGMTVTRPWGDSSHYDLIVECEGCWLRVQVKSSLRRRSNSYYFTLRGAIHRYTTEDFDFIAAYLVPADLWYIIPAEVALINGTQMCITPGSARSRYALYREAWHLLKQKRCADNVRDRDLCFRHGCQARLREQPATDKPEP
jgi:hypothetical protein